MLVKGATVARTTLHSLDKKQGTCYVYDNLLENYAVQIVIDTPF